MKRYIYIIFAATIITGFLSSRLIASGSKFGAGFILGSPSGLTGKLFISNAHAIDFGVGIVSDDLYVYGDYLLHFSNVFPVANLAIYLGIGGGFHDYEKEHKFKEDEDENRLEVRGPLGLEYMIQKIPLGLFVEIVPAMRVVPDVDFGIRGGLGVRYYF